MKITDHYTSISGLLLFLTAILAVIHFVYVDRDSFEEQVVFLIASVFFVLLASLNVSMIIDKHSDGMTKAHALGRCIMFIIGSAFALYLAVN